MAEEEQGLMVELEQLADSWSEKGRALLSMARPEAVDPITRIIAERLTEEGFVFLRRAKEIKEVLSRYQLGSSATQIEDQK